MHAATRRIATPAIRLAITVALLYVGVLVGGTLLLLAFTPADVTLDEALFDRVRPGHRRSVHRDHGRPERSRGGVIIAMMFIGRLGPVTIVSAPRFARTCGAVPPTGGATHHWLTMAKSGTRPCSGGRLGRFGSALTTLTELGVEVMAIDTDGAVQRYADRLTHTVQADATERGRVTSAGRLRLPPGRRGHRRTRGGQRADRQPAVGVRHPGYLGASRQKACPDSAASGANHAHRAGGGHGVRVAHLVGGRMLDYIEFGEFAMSRTEVPREAWGKSLANAKFRAKYGVTVVAINPHKDSYTFALPETVVNKGDILVVAGTIEALDKFGQLD